MHRIKINKGHLVLFVYLFYIAIQILQSTQMSLISGWQYINRFSAYITLFFLFCFLYNKKVKKIWLFISAILIVFGVVVAFSNDRLTATLIILLFIINGIYIREDDYDKVLMAYVKLTTFLVGGTILLSYLGIYYSDAKVTESGTVRNYLGFMAATHSPNYFFHIVLAYVAQKEKRISVLETCIILACNIYFYSQNATHAVFYYINALLILLWIIRKFPDIMGKCTWILALVMPAGAALSIWLAFNYNPSNTIMFRLNSILSQRLRLASNAVKLYGLPLFGTNVQWSTGRAGVERFTNYLFVDSAYVNIALTYGVITLVILLIGFTLMILKSQKQKTFNLSASLLFLGIHSFSDPQLFELKHNPLLLFLFGSFLFFYKERRYHRAAVNTNGKKGLH